MNMTKQLIIWMSLATLGAVARPQQGGGERRGPDGKGGAGFVDRLDRDGDGKISESEFDGPAEHFSRFEVNGDGFISEDEASTGPPPGRRQDKNQQRERPPRGGEESGPEGECLEGAGFVDRLDQNGDGKVSKAEFDGPAEVFRELDRNGDGFITEEEAPKRPPHNQE